MDSPDIPTFTSQEAEYPGQVFKRNATWGPRVGSRFNSVADRPESFELFILREGEQKVTMQPDTRSPNTAIFTFNKEDHTLGNLLRATLTKHDDVLFVAYKVPHPLFATFELRVQTTERTTPKDVVVAACKGLIGELTNLRNNLTREFELKRMAQDDTLR